MTTSLAHKTQSALINGALKELGSWKGGSEHKTTDYIGELVYENNNLQFAQTSEGRVFPDGGGWEYQYHLKDHLGNVRVTFTTKPQTPVSVSANLETGTSGSGEADFGDYTSTPYDLVDHTDAGTAYEGVQWLNGGASGRVGLTKSLSVMPGDRVSITAYAKYMNLSGTGNTNVFAAALTAAFGVSSGSTGEQLKLYNGLNGYGLAVAGGDHPDDNDNAPKAFVTILLFDRNYNLLDAASDQITTDLEQVSATQKESFAYPLSKEVVVHEPGFAYIFVSNEHPTYVDVYFDDVTVTHTLSPIVSASDYYPFGLTFNLYSRENATPQNFKYNGIENEEELGLNLNMTFFRMHDPALGRWWQFDPRPNPMNSPYSAMENNPMRYSDPLGDTIKFDPGSSKRFIKQFNMAVNKLTEKGAGAFYHSIAKSKQVYTAKEVKGEKTSSFNTDTKTLSWNSKQGLITISTKILSPATILNHEFDHMERFDRDPEGMLKDFDTKMDGYENKEEQRVIEGSEQKTARLLGEIGFDEVTRTDHSGSMFPVKNSTSTELDDSGIPTVTGKRIKPKN